MSVLYTVWCRVYQGAFWLGSHLLPWRTPQLLQGEGSLAQLPALLAAQGHSHALLVTDAGIVRAGLATPLIENLRAAGIHTTVYNATSANPTIPNIEEALAMYHAESCQCLIGLGGGSPIDCAKGVAARLARPNKHIPQLRGVLRVRKKTPDLYAVPTTAGTGSETTLAAVITDPATNEKYAVNDFPLIPRVAVLDPDLTRGLPPGLTATTGMDALTHAVEAYIGHGNTHATRQNAREATQLIFEHLYPAYLDGSNMQARAGMQRAAFLAGAAFTRAYVGNVHAVAHTLGGYYHIPHGLANAVTLPYVLACYGASAQRPLAQLCDLVHLAPQDATEVQKAAAFIAAVREMNRKMAIPDKIEGILDKDIPAMVNNAFHEANPLYPVPKVFTRDDFTAIYKLIQA